MVSNTKQKSLKLFAELTHLLHIFPEEKLFGADAHLGKGTKRELVDAFLQKNSFNELIVIGDSPGDMELGNAIGATTFLYTHPGLEFKECKSHYKTHDLRDVLQAI
ncbi:MAG: HAD family hydrolase [Patescibacteria group bacterium]